MWFHLQNRIILVSHRFPIPIPNAYAAMVSTRRSNTVDSIVAENVVAFDKTKFGKSFKTNVLGKMPLLFMGYMF